MPIAARCPACGEEFHRPDSLGGKLEKCPKCRNVFRLPSSASPSVTENVASDRTQPIDSCQPAKLPVRSVPVTAAFEEKGKAPLPPVIDPLVGPFRSSNAFKKIRDFNPKRIAKARATFANKMTDDETPLALYDRSFLGNGKAGILITDRAAYSSTIGANLFPGRPQQALLSDVSSVTVEHPTKTEAMLGAPSTRLMVNGQVFFTEQGQGGVLDTIAAIIDQLRMSCQCRHMSEVVAKPKPPKPVDHVSIAAGAACSGQSRGVVESQLLNSGLDAKKAHQMAGFMCEARDRHQRQTGGLVLRAFGGIALAIVGFFLAILASAGHGGAPFWTTGIVVVGVILFCSAIYRLFAGPPPIRIGELTAAWQNRAIDIDQERESGL